MAPLDGDVDSKAENRRFTQLQELGMINNHRYGDRLVSLSNEDLPQKWHKH
jgi:hypothetical protein